MPYKVTPIPNGTSAAKLVLNPSQNPSITNEANATGNQSLRSQPDDAPGR